MELWRELLISGLQNESYKGNYISDKTLKEIIESSCYKVLQQIKQVIDNDTLQDEECFVKIEEIRCVLEKNGILCDRHDFG